MSDFRVVSSQEVNRQFEQSCEQANSEGRGKFALEIAESLMAQLRADPLAVGEDVYELKHLELQVRHAVQLPWSIYFGIDEKRRIVYLKNIALLT